MSSLLILSEQFLILYSRRKYYGETSSEYTWNQWSAYNTSAVDFFHQMTPYLILKDFPH